MVVTLIEQHYYLMVQTLLIFMEESQLLKFLASLENKLFVAKLEISLQSHKQIGRIFATTEHLSSTIHFDTLIAVPFSYTFDNQAYVSEDTSPLINISFYNMPSYY